MCTVLREKLQKIDGDSMPHNVHEDYQLPENPTV